MRVYFLIIIFFLSVSNPLFSQIEDRLFPLAPNSIQLDGYLDVYIQRSIEQWNKGGLPYSEFVNFFKEGRPQFALGEMWGKAVRSGCMFYRYTRDPELKRIMQETVSDMLSAQDANGCISCSEPEKQPDGPNGDLWERKYVMLGMEEYYEWVHPDPAVLSSLIQQADCIMSQVGKAPKIEITDLGWSATNIGFEPCHIESSSLLEPFMRLYKWTGEQRFLDFATYIIEAGGTKHYNIFQMALQNVEPYKMAGHYPKAYEMLSIFEGLAEYYRVTGAPEIKQMLLNLYNNVRKYEITIIGNGGSDQPYHPQVAGEAWGNTALEQTNPDITRMMETCVGVTWLKFCSQLLRLTGDPSAMDEIEKYVYNGLIGAMKPTGDGFSYVNLLNGCKVNGQGWGWHFGDLHVTCCNLNGPMGVAYIPYVAAMNSQEGPVINLYNAGEIHFQSPDHQSGAIAIVTDYPVSGNIRMKVKLEGTEKFTLKLRIPEWSKATALRVNNKKMSVSPGSYAAITRKWKEGDEITLSLDMRCRVVDAPHGSNRAGDHFQAVLRGPVVLARDEGMDTNYNQPVSLQSAKGFIDAVQETPQVQNVNMQFSIPVEGGGHITMIDYASVNNWDNGKHVCTWVPTKE